MKTAVSSYSFGNYLRDENLGYMGIIEKAKELGFDGIEFTDAGFVCNHDNARKIREKCAELDLAIVALVTSVNFLVGDVQSKIDEVCSVIDIAEILGAPIVRTDVAPGFPKHREGKKDFDSMISELVDPIRKIADYAATKGIRACTENHGFYAQDACRMEKLVNAVNHPNFGALVDIGNFMCTDEDPTVSVGLMAPYAVHAHAKDFHLKSGMDVSPGEGWFQTRAGNYLRGAIIGHGDGKVYQSIQTLKRSGYDGFVTIEFEGLEDNLVGLKLGLENLKRFIEA